MAKLIMMRGLPASGKSTKAKELMEEYGNYVRLNRDLMRKMLHFDKWSGRNEKLTVQGQRMLAMHYLKTNSNVIIDDTNLTDRHVDRWRNTAKECNAKFEIQDMDTSVELCLERNIGRSGEVPEYVIMNMALMSGKYKPSKGFIICDLDGTLCDVEHRRHHVKKDPKDWKAFFEAMVDDTMRWDVYDMVGSFITDGYDIVYVSARPETYAELTMDWMRRNHAPRGDTLIMRKEKDSRPDTDVKRDILNTFFPDRSLIHKVIDDRPSVIRMWREEGLDVIDVGKGEEF